MTSNQSEDSGSLHRLPGTDYQQVGGLIIKKKTQAISSDEQHVFKMPQIPPTTSVLGLDKLAAEKRRVQSSASTTEPKRSKTSSFDDNGDDHKSHSSKSRHLREKREETPSSTRSSHHDYYDRSRPAPKHKQRGLAYGQEAQKQRMLSYVPSNNVFL